MLLLDKVLDEDSYATSDLDFDYIDLGKMALCDNLEANLY